MIFWRYFLYGSTVLVLFLLNENAAILKIASLTAMEYVGIILLGITGLTFTLAIQNAHVLNVFIVLSTNRCFSSLLDFVVFEEKIPTRSLVTLIIVFTSALCAMLWAMWLDMANEYLGIISAIVCTVATSVFQVVAKKVQIEKGESIELVPCVFFAAYLAAFTAYLMSDSYLTVQDVSDEDLLYLVIQGNVVLPIGLLCLSRGPQYITAAEAGIIMTLGTAVLCFINNSL